MYEATLSFKRPPCCAQVAPGDARVSAPDTKGGRSGRSRVPEGGPRVAPPDTRGGDPSAAAALSGQWAPLPKGHNDCIPPSDTSLHQDSTGTAPSATPPPAQPSPPSQTRETKSHSAPTPLKRPTKGHNASGASVASNTAGDSRLTRNTIEGNTGGGGGTGPPGGNLGVETRAPPTGAGRGPESPPLVSGRAPAGSERRSVGPVSPPLPATALVGGPSGATLMVFSRELLERAGCLPPVSPGALFTPSSALFTPSSSLCTETKKHSPNTGACANNPSLAETPPLALFTPSALFTGPPPATTPFPSEDGCNAGEGYAGDSFTPTTHTHTLGQSSQLAAAIPGTHHPSDITPSLDLPSAGTPSPNIAIPKGGEAQQLGGRETEARPFTAAPFTAALPFTVAPLFTAAPRPHTAAPFTARPFTAALEKMMAHALRESLAPMLPETTPGLFAALLAGPDLFAAPPSLFAARPAGRGLFAAPSLFMELPAAMRESLFLSLVELPAAAGEVLVCAGDRPPGYAH